MLGKIIAGEPVSATKHRSSVPANVDAALRCALEKLPADRFTSAQEFVKALGDEHFRHGEWAAAGMADASAAAGPWKGFSFAATILAAIFAIAFGWAFFRTSPEPAVRFVVTFSEGQEPTIGAGVNVALSPDGSRLIYTGLSQLWQRQLNELEPSAIPGTEGARNPALSPDGMSVAFMVQSPRSIKTVSLLGARPTTIVTSGVPAGQGGGVAWGSDGMLYFTDDQGGIQRVPASGTGEPEAVTTSQVGTFHRWADALPDGRGLLFTIARGGPDQSEIAVMGFGDEEVRTLFSGAMARYASSGHIIYADADGGLLRAPFDLGRLEVTGPSVGLIESVNVGPGSPARFALSENGTLLYVPGVGSVGMTPVWVERDGSEREIDPSWTGAGVQGLGSLALSPDGRRIALSVQEGEGSQDLWVKQLDTGPLSRITFDGTVNTRMSWSPDNESLTFISNRAGRANEFELWTKRADGTGAAELLLSRELPIYESLYSPDGAWLVFREGGTISGAGAGDIFAIQLGVDSAAVPLVATEFNERSPALSADGRWLAYTSGASGRSEIYVRPFPDVGSALVQVSTDGGTEPIWAHSGRELFYRSASGLVAVEVATEQSVFVAGRQEVLFSLGGWAGI